MLVPLFGMPGGMEMLVILLIAVLLFGANKIPDLARSTGEAMGEFKKGRQELEDELRQATDDDGNTLESGVMVGETVDDEDADDADEATATE
jgi:sec-independent protein translocase protein TatA